MIINELVKTIPAVFALKRWKDYSKIHEPFTVLILGVVVSHIYDLYMYLNENVGTSELWQKSKWYKINRWIK